MFNSHPALVKALQQDRYYRLVNEVRRCTTNGRGDRKGRPNQSDR